MKEFLRAAINRAIRTICQTAVATIGTAAVLEAVDWRMVISASILAGVLSILTSIATGLPEVEKGEEDEQEGRAREDSGERPGGGTAN